MRPSALEKVFEHAEAAFRSAPGIPPGSESLADRVWTALKVPSEQEHVIDPEPQALPVCSFLTDALQDSIALGGPISDLAMAFQDLALELCWERRRNAETGPGAFFHGHANAVLAGPNGLERRNDVVAGASLMAPGVRYPDHRHPPEEFYVVLSPGQWRQGDGSWYEPGPGGVVHHPPGMVHAMRSGDSPLLALWFLWTKD
ncbi:MAG: cupin domain-containing protein [Acidimicrobiales bacterium]|nr:cupin domain-containing protein [Acidimicrobiales bacterium]